MSARPSTTAGKKPGSPQRYLILGTGGASIDHEAALFRGGLAPYDVEWVNAGLGNEWIRPLTTRRFGIRVTGHGGIARIPRSGYRRWSVIPVLALGTGIGIVGIIVIIIIVVLVLRLR